VVASWKAAEPLVGLGLEAAVRQVVIELRQLEVVLVMKTEEEAMDWGWARQEVP
jgi:hypothetical protein